MLIELLTKIVISFCIVCFAAISLNLIRIQELISASFEHIKEECRPAAVGYCQYDISISKFSYIRFIFLSCLPAIKRFNINI